MDTNKDELIYFIDKAILRAWKADHQRTYRLINFDPVDFTDTEHVLDIYEKQQGLCTYCECHLRLDNSFMRLSIDRIQNKYAHIRGNIQLACIRCNLDRGATPDKLYRTKANNFYLDLINSLCIP